MGTQRTEDGQRNRPGSMTADEEHQLVAALVRQIMAESRARLAAEDAARELVRNGRAAEHGVVERPAAD